MYVYEFEFFLSNGYIDAVPCGDWSEGTFGDDLTEAVESAADWFKETVDDHLMGRGDPPPSKFGHEPVHSGQIIADGALESWREGSKRTGSKASVGALVEILLRGDGREPLSDPSFPRPLGRDRAASSPAAGCSARSVAAAAGVCDQGVARGTALVVWFHVARLCRWLDGPADSRHI